MCFTPLSTHLTQAALWLGWAAAQWPFLPAWSPQDRTTHPWPHIWGCKVSTRIHPLQTALGSGA